MKASQCAKASKYRWRVRAHKSSNKVLRIDLIPGNRSLRLIAGRLPDHAKQHVGLQHDWTDKFDFWRGFEN